MIKFSIKPQVIHEYMEGEVIIVDLETGNYYGLDGAGVDIWLLIKQGLSQTTINNLLANHYALDNKTITEATDQFIKQLMAEELIAPIEVAGESTETPTLPTSSSFQPPLLEKYTDMQGLLLADPIHEVDETGWPHRK